MDGINQIKKLKDVDIFQTIIRKLTIGVQLEYDELSFILSVSIIFLQEYQKDKRRIAYFNFAYFVILKVALINKLYQPLFDLSLNVGFYPINRFIFEKKLIESLSLESIKNDVEVDAYRYDKHIEMYQQRLNRTEILSSKSLDNVYIAPTSFGKSSLIFDIIRKNFNKKISIIVPSKSLLSQSIIDLKKIFPDKKIIFNEDMYDNEESFISVFTQERALRFFSKNKEIYFDVMIVDEAHNLLPNDYRAVILARAIRRNRFRSSNSKHYYLSPLINESKSLQLEADQVFFERKINLNIKDPDYFEFKETGDFFKYNRFLDESYRLGWCENLYEYIKYNQKNKNFIYLRSPKKVEEFSKRLCHRLGFNGKLASLSKILSENLHEDFYCVDYIKKGLIYLHGGIPDLIKDFLEYKFKTESDIKYLVANSVVLEGINFPIEVLFILNTTDLKIKNLINLIGRVNRLNEVFSNANEDLSKLNPSVHFVNDTYFNGKNRDMYHKMKLLKSSLFEDSVENPALLNTINDQLKNKNTGINVVQDNSIENISTVRELEDFLIYDDQKDNSLLKTIIEQDVHSIYNEFNQVHEILFERMQRCLISPFWVKLNIIDKIYYFFIKDFDYDLKIKSKKFLRFNYKDTRKYYNNFVYRIHNLSLKSHINHILKYYDWLGRNNIPKYKKFYIGTGFGEIPYWSGNKNKTCIDLSSKSRKQRANLALVHLKNETDFVNFDLSKFVHILYEIKLITEGEYNIFIYGSEHRENIALFKAGLSTQLINFLKEKKQLKNIAVTNGKLQGNKEFLIFMDTLDEMKKFEIFRLL
jgi:superfamily II DNA or RNA helicase